MLGVLVAVAFSIAAEGLFFTALALGRLPRRLGAAPGPPGRGPGRAAGLRCAASAVTAVVAGVLLAYPLWLHFAGPQRFHGTGFDPVIHAEDIAAYGAYPRRSLAGVAGLGTSLAPNPTEENSFFGLPLLLLAVACFVLLWRRGRAGPAGHPAGARRHRAGLRRAVLGAAWSKIDGRRTDMPLPFALLGHLPVFNAALPSRLALVVAPVIGLLLAYAVDALRADRPAPAGTARSGRPASPLALLPLLPVTPLLTSDREPMPRVHHLRRLAGVRLARRGARPGAAHPGHRRRTGSAGRRTRWPHRQGEFAIPAGFFLGPGGPDGRGRIGPVPRTSTRCWTEVGQDRARCRRSSPTAAGRGPRRPARTGGSRRWCWPTGSTAPSRRSTHDAVLRAATDAARPAGGGSTTSGSGPSRPADPGPFMIRKSLARLGRPNSSGS